MSVPFGYWVNFFAIKFMGPHFLSYTGCYFCDHTPCLILNGSIVAIIKFFG